MNYEEEVNPVRTEQSPAEGDVREQYGRKIRRAIMGIIIIWGVVYAIASLWELISASITRELPSRMKELGANKDLLYVLRRQDIMLQYNTLTGLIVSVGIFVLMISNKWLGKLWNLVDSSWYPQRKESFKAALFMGVWRLITAFLSRFASFNLGLALDFSYGSLVAFFISFITGMLEGFIFHRIAKNMAKHWSLLLLLLLELTLYFGGHIAGTYSEIAFGKPLEDSKWNKPVKELISREKFPKNRLYTNSSLESVRYRDAFFDECIVFGQPILDTFPKEIRAITAHQLGIRKNKKIIKQLAINGISIAFSKVVAVYLVIPQPLYYAAFGFASEPIIGALPISEILMSVFELFAHPIRRFMDRSFYYAADAHAVKLGYGEELKQFLMKYKKYGLWWKSVMYEFFLPYPTALKRIEYIDELKKSREKEKGGKTEEKIGKTSKADKTDAASKANENDGKSSKSVKKEENKKAKSPEKSQNPSKKN